MENKAHYTLIGAFVLALLISLFVFLIWLAKFDLDQKYVEYDIFFSESVFGLDNASPVTYNGIPVGEVLDISIAPNDPSKVRVTIQVEEETPVQEDSMATLGMQGITGVLFVQILGGEPGGVLLKPKEGQDRAVIPSTPSALGELLGGGGDLIQNALETFERVNQMLSNDNIKMVTDTLANVESLTGDLAAEGDTIRAMIQDLKATVANANDMLTKDLRPATANLASLSEKADSLISRLDALVADNSGQLTDFTHQGLPELQLLLSDLRALSQSLNVLTSKLAERPSEIIFKTQDPEYEVDK